LSRGAISTEKLTKFYGDVRGIHDLDLEVRPGEIFGLLGPNGAGKTTTIRLLLDYIRPTSGRATVLGMDARRAGVEIRRHVGYLAGDFAAYDNLTGAEFFEFLARLRSNVDRAYLNQLCEQISFDRSRKIGTLSKGNKQKAGLLQALMHRPRLLILDEPTFGLDPLVQDQVHHLLRAAASDGVTVFLSSHILSEVEALCERVGIVRHGLLVATETVQSLKARAVRRLTITFSEVVPETVFASLPGIQNVEVSDGRVRCQVTGSLDAVVKTAARYRVQDIVTEEPKLEDVFLGYYSDDDAVAREVKNAG